jgi:undecaprenyl-diphosphatase
MREYIILGIIQGILEWLPISSQGALVLINLILELTSNPLEVALFLHIGTFFAVLLVFRKDWLNIFYMKDIQLFKFLFFTSAISLIIGFILFQLIITITMGSVLLALIGTGLIFTSFLNKKKKRNYKNEMKRKQNIPIKVIILTGILQGLSVIPGISRTGSTIFGLSFTNHKPEKILKLSYLMSAPIIFVSTIYLLLKEPTIINAWPALVFSFFVGILTLKLILKFSKRINFSLFTLIFGILCILSAILTFFT